MLTTRPYVLRDLSGGGDIVTQSQIGDLFSMEKPSSRTRNLAPKAPYYHEPFSARLHEILEKRNETCREAGSKSGLDKTP